MRTRPSVELRPWPYPFQAGLAVCSDIDGCSERAFLAIHRVLNLEPLSLPVADSFFGHAPDSSQLAFLTDWKLEPSSAAGFIEEAIGAGLIDSIHSWGDYNDRPPEGEFLRCSAELITDRLEAAGLKLRVWINHGDEVNDQNLYARLMERYQGDDPGAQVYTADLVRRLGVEFYWPSEMVDYPLSTGGRGAAAKNLERAVKNAVKKLLGRGRTVRTRRSTEEALYPVELRDGSRIWGFNRFNRHPDRLWGLPTREVLRYQLAEPVLSGLVESGGCAIVYTHLGFPVWDGRSELFAEEDLAGLKNLARAFHEGRIWVTPTGRFLTYLRTREFLRPKVEDRGGRTLIHLDELDDPVGGSRQATKDDLAGLSFYVDEPDKTALVLNGEELPVRIDPKEADGRTSISLALPPAPEVGLL